MVPDRIVDDLDRFKVEMSDVETREIDGLELVLGGGAYCNKSRRRCAVRMVSCIAAMVSWSVCTSDWSGNDTEDDVTLDVDRLDIVVEEVRDSAADVTKRPRSSSLRRSCLGGKAVRILPAHLRTMSSI